MVTPAAGAVVLVPFPFSDLSQAKLRPAVVLADAGRGDWILCQVTSSPYGDDRAIKLVDASFADGSLRITSYARPGKLFTANRSLMTVQVGNLRADPFKQIVEAIVDILRASLRRQAGKATGGGRP
jgi:mRNA interferase MazF